MIRYLTLHICVNICLTTGFWWLNKEGVFGGMNYDDQEIAAGLHIRDFNSSVRDLNLTDFIGVRNAAGNSSDGDPLLSRQKRQGRRISEPRIRNTLSGVVPFEKIVTECPVGSNCVNQSFCIVDPNQDARRNLIPCLIREEPGNFGVCCTETFPRVCPRVRIVPPSADCALTVDECSVTGEQDTCPEEALCCWNGCSKMCVLDPPYEVLDPFFRRGFFREVGRRPRPDRGESSGGRPSRPTRPTRPTREPTITSPRPTRRPIPTTGRPADNGGSFPFNGEPTTFRPINNIPTRPTTASTPLGPNGIGEDDGFDYDDYDFEIFSRKANRNGNRKGNL